jgi:hypothetical protein
MAVWQLCAMAGALLVPRWCTSRKATVHPYIPYADITLPSDVAQNDPTGN